MLKKNALYVLFLFSLFSCTRELKLDPPFEGEKLVVNGRITNSEISVRVTHSVNPVREYPPDEDLTVHNASITLYENNIPVALLEHKGNGIYGLPDSNTLMPSPDAEYILKASSPEYGEAISEAVILPSKPGIAVEDFVNVGISNYRESGLLTISIPELSVDSMFFYIIALESEEYPLYIYRYPHSEAALYFENCEATVGNSLIYDNTCGLSETTMQFIIPLQSSLGAPFYDTIRVNIGVCGRELFLYAKSYNELYGMEYGFSEPPILKSNMKGGYGLFYALNTFEYLIVNQ